MLWKCDSHSPKSYGEQICDQLGRVDAIDKQRSPYKHRYHSRLHVTTTGAQEHDTLSHTFDEQLTNAEQQYTRILRTLQKQFSNIVDWAGRWAEGVKVRNFFRVSSSVRESTPFSHPNPTKAQLIIKTLVRENRRNVFVLWKCQIEY